VGHVVVAGSINMDVVATAARHPNVGETVLGTDLRFLPGGKGANQAVAAARLGARTSLLGKVGEDAFGEALLEFLAGQGVDLSAVTRVGGTPTGTALIVVNEQSDNSIVVVPGANVTLVAVDVDRVELRPGDVLVAQYEIPLPVVRAALARARRAGATTILNPAPALETPAELLGLADVVVVNETELAFLTAGSTNGGSVGGSVADLARELQGPGQVVIATLGPDGAVMLVGDEEVRVAGRRVQAVDSTGAGDCFVGALAASLSSGTHIADAVRFANVAASLSVERVGAGTGMPSLEEVTGAAEADLLGP
jgi:ribokinase